MDQPVPITDPTRPDLSDENAALVLAVLQKLDEIEPGLAQRAQSYVASGQEQAILEALLCAQSQTLLGLDESDTPGQELRALFTHATLNAEQWLRLARIWHDAERFCQDKPRIDPDLWDFKEQGLRGVLYRESNRCGRIEGSPFQRFETFKSILEVTDLSRYWPSRCTLDELEPFAQDILSYPETLLYLKANRKKIANASWFRIALDRVQRLLASSPEFIEHLAPMVQRYYASHLPKPHEHIDIGLFETFIEDGIVETSSLAPHIFKRAKDGSYNQIEYRRLLAHCPEPALEYATEIFQNNDPAACVEAACLLDATRNEKGLALIEAKLDQTSDPELVRTLTHVISLNRTRNPDPAAAFLDAHAKTHNLTAHAPLGAKAKKDLEAQLLAREIQSPELCWVIDALENLVMDSQPLSSVDHISQENASHLANALFAHPEVGYLHLVRLMLLCGEIAQLKSRSTRIYASVPTNLIEQFAECKGQFNALHFLACCRVCNVNFPSLISEILAWSYQQYPILLDLESLRDYCHVDPRPLYLKVNLDPLNLSSDLCDYIIPETAYRVLGSMSQMPEFVESKLMERALQATRQIRQYSQLALAGLDGLVQKVAARLENGELAQRNVAAQWLGDLGQTSAIPFLETQLKKERSSLVYAHLLRSLSQLGHDLDAYLSPAALVAQADKNTPKKLPSKIAWFPFEILPPLYWKHDDTPVEPRLVKWWLLSSIKVGEVHPSPLHALYLERVCPKNLKSWGYALFLAWILRDERFYAELANGSKNIEKELTLLWTIPGVDTTKAIQATLQYQSSKPESVSSSKGLLAWIASSQTPDISEHIDSYVRKYAKEKTAFCKQLLNTLSHIDDLRAFSVIAGLAQGLKRGSIKSAAEELVQEVADRQGWTIDELTDRTLSRAGLDDHGECILNLGPRTLTLFIDDALNAQVRDSEGKVKKTMPSERKSDDSDLYAQAKKQFRNSKKTIKSLIKDQSSRLRNNMRSQREWTINDWRTYMCGHPLLSKLATRLIWVIQEGKDRQYFRPLGDGTLSDAQDEMVNLPKEGKIMIAHSSMMQAAQIEAWRSHLQDYEVSSLFEQLETPPLQLTTQQLASTQFDTYKHKTITYYHFRNLCLRAGFHHEEPGDGGGIYSYQLELPASNIVAIIEIDNAWVGMEDQEIELGSLSFEQVTKRGAPKKLKLEKVPRVFVHDCVSLLSQIVGEES